MFPQLVNRFRGAAAAAAAMGLALALAGCASAPSGGDASPELSGVRVETGSDATRVVLLGTVGAQPTAVEEQDPARIVVELPAGVAASAEGATPVWDGMLEEVTVTRAADDAALTKVVVGLAAAASWEMQTSDEGLVLVVSKSGELASAGSAGETPADPWAPAAEAASSESAPAAEAMPAASEAKRATQLTGVSAKVEGDGVVVDLAADGRIDGAHAFLLESPPRLVVDLPEMKSAVAQSRVAVEHPVVKAVRVGQHEGKVRVVVDGAEDAKGFAEKTAPHANGMWLALAGAELPAMAEAMPMVAESAPAEAEAMPAGEPAPVEETAAAQPEAGGKAQMVHGVQLDTAAGQDRVVIVTDAPADYALTEVDEKTLMVQVRGAHIQPDAAVRLTPEQPSVVSMVAAFEQPEMKTPEVRVVVERAPGAKPVVSQHGTMLMLEFAHAGEPAQPVPVMAGEMPAAAPTETASADPAAGETAVAGASAKAMKQAKRGKQPGPAAIDPDGHGIEVLEEGGLLEGKVYTGRRISLDFKDVDSTSRTSRSTTCCA
jgi:hypothetical protein